jgi:L-threonine kinase
MEGGARSAAALVPCTCGELVQGSLGGRPFLVSCPIDRYSRVQVTLWSSWNRQDTKDTKNHGESCTLVPSCPGGCVPPGHEKAERAVRAALEFLGMAGTPFHLEVSCPLPPSKGFGTSTADVVGAIAATAAAVGQRIDPANVALLAVSVEPSDGTMFPGLALFDHRGASLAELLGPAPPLLVVALEFEGTVDTLEFNSGLELSRLRDAEREHARALDLLRDGLRRGRLESIGEAATLSARANQRILPKPELEEVVALAEGAGALGVCAAHSGTALGALFAPGEMRGVERLLAAARSRFERLCDSWISTIADGGARLLIEVAPGLRNHEDTKDTKRHKEDGASALRRAGTAKGRRWKGE